MKITVTGGTGFIGNYVVEELLRKDLDVIVIGKNIQKAKNKYWFSKVEFIESDINKMPTDDIMHKIASSDKLIHLAWSGLPNYKELFHFEENLLPQYFFLKKLTQLGLADITITGTCLEYGMRNGCLTTDMLSDPQNPYSLAKDTLRKFLQQLQLTTPFYLKWIRLFYMYGKGQSENSILSQLDKALLENEPVFNMSGGEQLRDYMSVEMVAENIVLAALTDETNKLENCCSGKPISIRSLVENHLRTKEQSIQLNLGYYAYPQYEPMAFWGDVDDNSNQ